MPNPSGYPAFVRLLRRSCPSEGNTSAAAHRTAVSLWLRSNLRRCTSEPTPHLHAHCAMFIEVTSAMHIQNKLFPQLGSRDVEFWNPCTSWSRPRNICSAGWSRWHLPRRSPPFIWLGPQPTQKCWQQWPTDELTLSRKRLLPPAWWRQTTTELAFDSRMLKLKMKSRRGRAGRHGGARVSTVDCARSPYGGIHIQTKSTFICGFNGVGGGGVASLPPPKLRSQIQIFFPSSGWKKKAFGVQFEPMWYM